MKVISGFIKNLNLINKIINTYTNISLQNFVSLSLSLRQEFCCQRKNWVPIFTWWGCSFYVDLSFNLLQPGSTVGCLSLGFPRQVLQLSLRYGYDSAYKTVCTFFKILFQYFQSTFYNNIFSMAFSENI